MRVKRKGKKAANYCVRPGHSWWSAQPVASARGLNSETGRDPSTSLRNSSWFKRVFCSSLRLRLQATINFQRFIFNIVFHTIWRCVESTKIIDRGNVSRTNVSTNLASRSLPILRSSWKIHTDRRMERENSFDRYSEPSVRCDLSSGNRSKRRNEENENKMTRARCSASVSALNTK